MPIMTAEFPLNVLTFISIVYPVVNFDLMDNFEWFGEFIKKMTTIGVRDENFDQEIPAQISALGIDSRNPLENLSTLALIQFGYILKLVLMLFSHLLKWKKLFGAL